MPAETARRRLLDYTGITDLRSASGRVGTLLLDPQNVRIATTGATPTLPGSGATSFQPTDADSVLSVATLQNALALGNVAVAKGGPAMLPIAILQQEYNTAVEVYRATQAFILLKGQQNDLSQSILRAGQTDILLLISANLYKVSGNKTRANQELTVVNTSLAQTGASFAPGSREAQEWTIVSLLVQAKRDTLARHLDWASQEMQQANEAATALGAHYIQFMKDARVAFDV